MPHNPVHLIVNAAAFAAHKHRHQTRKNAARTPYINHPLALARILTAEAGLDDAEVIAAAILHDTIEDTETTVDELKAEFGERIASIVAEVTDDKRLPKEERKRLQVEHAPHLSREAKLVKLADKIANLRDVDSDPPHKWDTARRLRYFEWAYEVVAGIRGTHVGLEARFDEVFLSGSQRLSPKASGSRSDG